MVYRRDVRLPPENCDKCNEPLDADNTFRVRIIGGPPPQVVCTGCHDIFIRMIEDLFSSRKVGGYDPEQINRMNTEWFNAPVVQR